MTDFPVKDCPLCIFNESDKTKADWAKLEEAQIDQWVAAGEALEKKLKIKHISLSCPFEGEPIKKNKTYTVEVRSAVGRVKGPISYTQLLKFIDTLYAEHLKNVYKDCHSSKKEKLARWDEEFQTYFPCCGDDHRFLEGITVDDLTKTISTSFGS